MSKSSLHVLTWSEEQQCYALTTREQFQRVFCQEDEPAWVQEHTAFAFEGRSGHLSVIKEARTRGAGYWYAYSRQARRTYKRYLGRTATFSHLEQVASELMGQKGIALKLVAQTTRITMRDSQSSFPSTSSQSFFSLLATKLSSPQLPALLVERERLLNDLDAVFLHRLVFVSAAAGSGKTTLLSAWAVRQRVFAHLVSWLSLDEQDNDPMRFWSYVIAALRLKEPAVGETALGMLQAPQPLLLSTILTTFINDLATSQADVALVLDDYHVIDNPTIVSSFHFFLEHLPPRLHLILAGRSEPQLALPRLRARGQVVDLGDHDLRFTRAETTHFFTQAMKRPLAEEEIDVLDQRVEGWIAGLQLAALAMRARAASSAFVWQLSGSQRFILEYMQEEILEPQSQEVQDFLLHVEGAS